MIEYRTGNIWDALDSGEAQSSVIPVNCVGVMGAGLAKQAKERGYFDEYKFICDKWNPKAGEVYSAIFTVDTLHFALYAFTKDHWRNPSKIEWIDSILNALTDDKYAHRVHAVPALGCGLGGLKWPDVKALCEKYLADSETKFLIYEPK